jgi:hypothetical protein
MTILANRVTAGTCGRRRIARIRGEYDPQPRICVLSIGNQHNYHKNSALFSKPHQTLFFSVI